MDEHPALHRPLSSTVQTAGQRTALQKPQLGESLEFDLDGSPLRTSPVLNIEERGRGSQRSVMAPRSSAQSSSTALASTFPSAPLPAAATSKPANTITPAPKPAASGTHKAAKKSSRWSFRRRSRLTTAERIAQESREADSTVVTTRGGESEPRADKKRLAR